MNTLSQLPGSVDLNRLSLGSVIDVETKSRHYRIEYLGGIDIRISGHPDFCPAPVSAQLQGSLGREGEVDWGFIEPGRRLVFFLNDQSITTSRVLSVHVDRPRVQAESSPSVH